MSLISFPEIQNLDDATPELFNSRYGEILAEINGNLTSDNLANGAVSTPKIADSAVTAAKIADGAVTAAKASTMWWEELGRTTLSGVADIISVSPFTAKKYLKIIISMQGTGGTVDVSLRFNGDTASNYARRENSNGAASDTTTASQTHHLVTGPATYANLYYEMDVINISNLEKVFLGWRTDPGTAGAAGSPGRMEGSGKWANTSTQITSVSIANLSGTGDYASGSEIVVLGHN